jgi:hypothetical protein
VKDSVGDRLNTVRAGVAIALVMAGWPLYQLVTSGDLDVTSAVLRAGVVAAGCTYGVSLIVRLVSWLEAETRAEKEAEQQDQQFDELHAGREDSATEESPTSPDDETPTD